MKLQEYKALITAFLEYQIPVEEFEHQFLNAFKSESEAMDEALYQVLDRLFSSVDSYWPECDPGEETTFTISEKQLRHDAAKALLDINQLQGASG